uniref:Uncharacterized protein n=1 Tax=Onchocerca volvulus TaxID=6282 RepID=A0A8R1XSQ3_ONCVO
MLFNTIRLLNSIRSRTIKRIMNRSVISTIFVQYVNDNICILQKQVEHAFHLISFVIIKHW